MKRLILALLLVWAWALTLGVIGYGVYVCAEWSYQSGFKEGYAQALADEHDAP